MFFAAMKLDKIDIRLSIEATEMVGRNKKRHGRY